MKQFLIETAVHSFFVIVVIDWITHCCPLSLRGYSHRYIVKNDQSTLFVAQLNNSVIVVQREYRQALLRLHHRQWNIIIHIFHCLTHSQQLFKTSKNSS